MAERQIFIQNRKTREFLRSTDLWVSALEEAKQFNSALQAYHFAISHKIPEVEIVFQDNKRVESILESFSRRSKGSPSSDTTQVSC